MTMDARGWVRVLGGGLGLSLLGCAGPGSQVPRTDLPNPDTAGRWDQLEARRVTDSSSDQLAPSWSSDGQSLLYQNNSDGNWELYSLLLSDGRPQRLTDTPEAEEDPSWSPDGRWIVCTRHAPTLDPDPPREIWLMDREGKQGRVLAAHGADDWFPRFTQDGLSLVFLSDRVDERKDAPDEERLCALFQVSLEDGALSQLSEPGQWSAPVPTARGLALRLSAHSLGWLGAQGPEVAWQDSSQIVGQPDWREASGWIVSRMNLDQGGQLQWLEPGAATWLALPLGNREADMSPVWSPDGGALAFAGRQAGQWDLYLLQGGAKLKQKP